MYRAALLLLCAGMALAQFQCPPEDGFYVDPGQCDKYYDCYRGTKTEKLCPDGLVFEHHNGYATQERCEYPFLQECDPNHALQAPQPSGPNKECPRQNGIFEHENPNNCMDYYECTNGIFAKRTCTTGLVFDEFTGRCVWEASGVRQNCEAPKPLVLEDGFSCDQVPQLAGNGQAFDHARYIDEKDCRNFYVCLNGKFPKKEGCPQGTVFDDVKLECGAPEDVPGCECYYYPPGECPLDKPGNARK